MTKEPKIFFYCRMKNSLTLEIAFFLWNNFHTNKNIYYICMYINRCFLLEWLNAKNDNFNLKKRKLNPLYNGIFSIFILASEMTYDPLKKKLECSLGVLFFNWPQNLYKVILVFFCEGIFVHNGLLVVFLPPNEMIHIMATLIPVIFISIFHYIYVVPNRKCYICRKSV